MQNHRITDDYDIHFFLIANCKNIRILWPFYAYSTAGLILCIRLKSWLEAVIILLKRVLPVPKVIIHNSWGEVSLVEQDTIEYVSWSIEN